MKITIYTMPNCPNCTAAKQLMQIKGLTYTERSLTTEKEREGFYAIAGTAVRQMPQIYVNDERIGGFAGLRQWIMWKEAQ